MKIVAFLQNQWFRNPERAKFMLDKYQARDKDGGRERFLHDFLFFGCLTGRRLLATFGEDLCRQIIWEETSKEIGGKSSSAMPIDYTHINHVLEKHNPDLMILFGARAAKIVEFGTNNGKISHIICPHPAARGSEVVNCLKTAAKAVKDALQSGAV